MFDAVRERKNKFDFDKIRSRTAEDTQRIQERETTGRQQAVKAQEQRMQEQFAKSTEQSLKNHTNSQRAQRERQQFEAGAQQLSTQTAPKTAYEERRDKAREIPVIGGILRGLDRFQEFTEPAAKVAQQVYTPGAPVSVVGAAYRGAQSLAARALPRLTGTGGKVAREAVSEAIVGAPLAAGNILAHDPDVSGKEFATQTAIGTAAGAGIGAAMPLLGRGLSKLFQSRGVPESTVQDVLALPAGRERGNPNRANPPRVIVDADTRPVGLPEPSILPPTTARRGQAVNVYRQKFESLIDRAKQLESEGKLTPGREDEDLRSLWSQMADPTDPDLDTLIDLAYKPRQRKVNFDSVRKARETQRMREVAGVPPLVRSMADRYQPTVGNAAPPVDRVGRAAGTPVGEQNIRPRFAMGEVLEASAQPPNPRIDVTPEVAAVESVDVPKQHWFEKLFGSQGVGITPGAKNSKELIDTHVVDRSKAPASLLERAQETVSNVNQDYVDRFAPFRLISKETYDAAMDSTKANNLANITVRDKFVDLEGNVIGKSLKEVYDTVPRGQKHIADRYVILRDAADRMDRNITVYGKEKWFPQSADEARRLVTNLEQRYPWLRTFGEDWNQFNRNRQDLWVKSGIASQDLIDTLRHTNPNYTPMFRQQEKGNLRNRLSFNTAKSGFSGQKAPIKRAVGSTKKIIEPAQGMIETTGSSYNAMLRNRAMQNLYKAVLDDPERYKGVIEIIEESQESKQSLIRQMNKIIDEQGLDGIANFLNDETNNAFTKAKQATGKSDAVVTVMVEGNPIKMRVYDPSILKAVEGISPTQLGAIVNIVDTVSRGIKYAATGGLAPLQGAKLALRDLPIAFAQSKDKTRFLNDIGQAMISQVADWLPDFVPGAQRLGGMAREYYRAGGGYEAYLKGDSRLRRTSADLTKDPILSSRNLMKTAMKVNPFRVLKGFGDAMENIPRIAAFNAAMRRNGWKRDEASVRKALEDAREATVNWSRKGYKSAEIESFLPYSNAAVQGTYRFVKRFKEQPASAIALIMGIAGAKIAAYEQFKDDPDYQHRSKFEKGIPIAKTADGKFRTIPVEPTEAYVADQILNFYKWATGGENDQTVKETIQEGVDAFFPKYVAAPAASFTQQGKAVDLKAGISTLAGGSAFEPITALTTGKNFYGGDIVPREYQGLSTNLKHNETTSAAGKWAAENLGIDAFTFDYIADKFGGDLAKVGLPMTSAVGKGDPVGNIMDEVMSRLKLLEDPVMRNNIANEYFSLADSVSKAKESFSRKDIPLPDWYQQAYDEVTSQKKDSLATRISELNRMKREIERDTTLSAKKRADDLREVQTQINLMRLQGIKRLEELGVPKGN